MNKLMYIYYEKWQKPCPTVLSPQRKEAALWNDDTTHIVWQVTSGVNLPLSLVEQKRFSVFFFPPNKVSIKYVFVEECCCYSITNRWISSAPEELRVPWENSRLTLWPPLCAVCPPGRHRGPPASHSHGTLGDNLCLHYFLPHVYALLFRNQFNMARLLQQYLQMTKGSIIPAPQAACGGALELCSSFVMSALPGASLSVLISSTSNLLLVIKW